MNDVNALHSELQLIKKEVIKKQDMQEKVVKPLQKFIKKQEIFYKVTFNTLK